MKAVDLTGQKFGNYTVIKRVPAHVVAAEFPKSNGEAIWYCRCKCGEIGMVYGGSLRAGRSHGCRSCSAKGRYNGGNSWKAEDAERKRREDARRAFE